MLNINFFAFIQSKLHKYSRYLSYTTQSFYAEILRRIQVLKISWNCDLSQYPSSYKHIKKVACRGICLSAGLRFRWHFYIHCTEKKLFFLINPTLFLVLIFNFTRELLVTFTITDLSYTQIYLQNKCSPWQHSGLQIQEACE